jgi:nucleoside-diphosphate-sugar epimerase
MAGLLLSPPLAPLGHRRAMRTVVVTGVAGSLGQRVVERLLRSGDVGRIVGVDVVSLTRFPPPVETLLLDLSDDATPGDAFEVACAGADGIIHLAWRTADGRGEGRSGARPAAVANRRALERVLGAAAEGRVGSVVHLSSATVYGAWPDNSVPLSEDSLLRPNPEFGFAVEKADAEWRVATWSEEHPEVAVAVLRPAVTVGAPERPLYRALAGTDAPGSTDAGRPVQFLHVDDLADAVVFAWQHRLQGPYNVAPDSGTPEATARALAGGVARVRLPVRLAQAVGSWSWDLWRLGVPREAAAYATHPWVVAPDRLKGAGWTPRFTSEEALVATDARAHWDDLPPGRRQNYTLLAVLAALGVLGASAVVGVVAWRRRR